MASITASLVVQFGAGSSDRDGHLSAEIDDRPTGLNGGDTSFSPGDTAWFLVFKSSGVTLGQLKSSAGTVSYSGSSINVTREEDVSFLDSNDANLQVPALSISSVTWMGTDLGAVSVNGTALKSTSKGVAVARVQYVAQAWPGKLVSPTELDGLDDFPIAVLITGTKA